MNTEFIDSFRRPKLHGNFIMDLNPFSKLNLCALIAAFAGLAGGVASSVAAPFSFLPPHDNNIHIAMTAKQSFFISFL